MTIQYDKIIAVIVKDANTKSLLKRNTFRGPKYCIVGGLLHEAGTEPAVNASWPNAHECEVLLQHYGITNGTISALSYVNDKHPTRRKRQAALKALVNNWKEQDDNA